MSEDKPIFDEKGQWGKVNLYLPCVIAGSYEGLGQFAPSLLMYIIGKYNRECYTNSDGVTGVALSYGDIQKMFRINQRMQVRNIIKVLLECGLLVVIKKGVGKGKTIYKPDINAINKLLKEYLENNPNDKE